MNQNVHAFRPYLAEAVGTFALVFAGTGAIVVNAIADGVITHVGIALTFGLVVVYWGVYSKRNKTEKSHDEEERAVHLHA